MCRSPSRGGAYDGVAPVDSTAGWSIAIEETIGVTYSRTTYTSHVVMVEFFVVHDVTRASQLYVLQKAAPARHGPLFALSN